MAIVMAGKVFTVDDLKRNAGQVAAVLTDAVEQGNALRVQLESWPDPDLLELGLTQPEINAIKGFYVGDLPTITAQLTASTWIKQLLGTGV
jgi:hypothetical protein